MPSALSLTKKSGKKKSLASKLSDKIESPASLTAKKKPGNVRTNTFSLVRGNRNKIGTSTTSSRFGKDIPIKRNNFIIRLKVNKTLYQQVFGSLNKGDTQNMANNKVPFGNQVQPFDEIRLELQKEKSIDIPEIYKLSELDIQPEHVFFKNLNDLNMDGLNQKLNNRNLNNNNKKIHLILSTFKNKKWPNKSPYACWNCTEYFTNPPIGIPSIAQTQSTNYQDTYYLEGNFCSFNCAARHLFDTTPTSNNQLWTINEIMNCMYNELCDSDMFVKIKLAPERTCLKKFGGILTLEEYRKNFLTNIDYKVFKTPLIPALYHIQETMDLSKIIKHRPNDVKKSNFWKRNKVKVSEK